MSVFLSAYSSPTCIAVFKLEQISILIVIYTYMLLQCNRNVDINTGIVK